MTMEGEAGDTERFKQQQPQERIAKGKKQDDESAHELNETMNESRLVPIICLPSHRLSIDGDLSIRTRQPALWDSDQAASSGCIS